MGSIDKSENQKVQDPRRQAFQQNLHFIHQMSYTVEEIARLFDERENKKCFCVGEVDFPTGKVIAADPLVYLYHPKYAQPLSYTIKPGTYPVYLSVHVSQMAGLRIVAAKLKVTGEAPVRYEIAMPDGATIKQLNEPGILAGFGVDAGMGSFCDQQVAQEYGDFLALWHEENPKGNHYDDYFAALFADSYVKLPGVQRPGGDFIQWAVPDTGHRFCMFATGLGDGFYCSHWGFDRQGNICELIIPFMNPDLFD